MHLLLTDRLTCPRCGPDHGLILLAREIIDRRVLDGEVGCANCREHFPIVSGFADLRWPSPSVEAEGPASESSALEEPDSALAVKVAALLGLTDGSGFILLAGQATAAAAALSEMLAGDEWIALGEHLRGQPESAGISRIAASREHLPLSSGGLRGAALDAQHADWLPEVTRALAPGARVACFGPPAGLAERAGALGLEVVLDAPEALVATRGPALIPLRRTPAKGSFGA